MREKRKMPMQVSCFVFPTEKTLQKKWIHAIRQEEGKHFTITQSTKVYSRHFRDYDLKKSLAGRMSLRPNAVPSLFSWTRTSPWKRKTPTPREFESGRESSNLVSEDTNEENIMDVSDDDSASTCEHGHVLRTPSKKMPQKEHDLAERQEQWIRELEQQLIDLQAQAEDLQRQNEQLQSKLFSIDRFKEYDSAINFNTGFPNWDTFMAVFRYLNWSSGENITYWLSSKQTPSSDTPESKRGRNRTPRPLDEYFLVMYRLRQGFREDHLGHLFHISISTVNWIFIAWIKREINIY